MNNTKLIPYGSDVSSGTYRCADCGFELKTESVSSLPPCPNHSKQAHSQKGWYAVTGGDAMDDPQSRK